MPTSPSTRPSAATVVSVVLVVTISIIFYVTLGTFAYQNALNNDFLGFYAAGKQVAAGDGVRLHDHKVQFEYQKALNPNHIEVVPFPRPRYYAEVFRWLSAWPMPQALLIWQAIQSLAYLGVWVLIVVRYRTELLQIAALFIAAPIGIANGQDSGFMALFAALSLFLFQSARPFLAGLALAMCLFKWHLVLLVPVAMLLARQFRMLAGFGAGALVFLILDFALAGAAGWARYIELLGRRDLDRMTPGLHLMPNIYGLFANLGIPHLWWLGLFVVIPCLVLCALRLPWPKAIVAAQLASILCVPHAFLYDLSYLLYANMALLASGAQGHVKWAAFLLTVPLIYFANMLVPPWTGLLALAEFYLLVSLALGALRRDPALQ